LYPPTYENVPTRLCKEQCQRTQATKTTHGLDGQHQDVEWTGLPVEESVRLTEDRDKWRKYVHGVVNPRIEDG